MSETLKVTCTAVFALLWIGCSSNNKPLAFDSNSNWLAACDVTADCEGDGTCICGLCTAVCSDDVDCASAGPGASCVAPAAASDETACAAIVQAAGERICLAECSRDDDCAAQSQCVGGACWAAPSSVIDLRDASTDASTDASSPRPDAAIVMTPPVGIDAGTNVWALDPAVDFDEPVEQPLPQTVFRSDAAPSMLVGTWVESSSDFWGGPIRLEITTAGATGGVTGTISFMCEPGACDPEGPPPLATDPEVTYPPGLDPRQQDLRTNILPRTPYRMFDARLADGRLTFWFTNNDLWRDWCPLQTPHETSVEGRLEHACIENAESCWDIYSRAPDDPIVGRELLCCTDGPCHCDANACDINYQSAIRTLDFEVEGDTMQGIVASGGDTFLSVLTRDPVAAP